MNYNDFIRKLQDIVNQYKPQDISNQYKEMVESGVDIEQELRKSIDDLLLHNAKEKTERAFRLALLREMTGIDAEMNLNSLKQDLEEIKNPIKSEGRKDL